MIQHERWTLDGVKRQNGVLRLASTDAERLLLVRFEVQEDHLRRVSDRNVVSRKCDLATLLIDAKRREVIGALVARIKKITGRCESEAAWVVPSSPFVGKECQLASIANAKDPDAVVQSISDVDESPVI